jgi:ribosomal protein S11
MITKQLKSIIFLKNFKKIPFKQKSILPKIERKTVFAFLFIRVTKNNFFATIVNTKGQTLVTRSGGNSERTEAKQRSSVLSADKTIYEACYLA